MNRQQIEQTAYQLWQQRGSPEGSSESDWLEAERQSRAAPATLAAGDGADHSAEVQDKDAELERNPTRDLADVSHAK